jgi:hypothetical protein
MHANPHLAKHHEIRIEAWGVMKRKHDRMLLIVIGGGDGKTRTRRINLQQHTNHQYNEHEQGRVI